MDTETAAARIKNEGLVTLLLSITITMVVMNTMMFNLALPEVAKQFLLSSISTSWIVTGYSIVFAISSITYSRLSDFIPIRNLFMIGLISLGFASIIGYFSNSFVLLLCARLIQATGAGAMSALGIVLITRFIPVIRRGKAMAMVMSASSLGLGLGPVIGGVIVQYLGWHYLFAVTAITIILIPVFYKLLPSEAKRSGTFDMAGALFIGVGTTGLLLFLTSHYIIALVAGVLSLVLFWLRIHRTEEPFVQPELFRNKKFMALGALGVTSYMNNFATLFLLPQVFAFLYGLTPAQSGLIIFPGSIVTVLASRPIGSLIDRSGNSLLIRFAPVSLLTASILLSLTATHSYIAIMLVYMLMSISFSALTSSVSNEISLILPQQQIGSGMGLFQLAQFFSGAFTVALAGSALVWQQKLSQVQAYSHIFWGMTAVVGCTLLISLLYGRRAAYAMADTGKSQ